MALSAPLASLQMTSDKWCCWFTGRKGCLPPGMLYPAQGPQCKKGMGLLNMFLEKNSWESWNHSAWRREHSRNTHHGISTFKGDLKERCREIIFFFFCNLFLLSRPVDIRKKFFMMKVVRQLYRLPREAVDAPFEEVFNTSLNGVLSNLITGWCPCLCHENGSYMIFKYQNPWIYYITWVFRLAFSLWKSAIH